MAGPCDQYGMETNVSIRLANASDAPALRRVAGRDSRRLPEGDLLVAVVGGEVRAALSLRTGESVADPFHPTASLIELLRLRAHYGNGHRPGTRGGVGKLALRSAET
jgi:hypothetical protein